MCTSLHTRAAHANRMRCNRDSRPWRQHPPRTVSWRRAASISLRRACHMPPGHRLPPRIWGKRLGLQTDGCGESHECSCRAPSRPVSSASPQDCAARQGCPCVSRAGALIFDVWPPCGGGQRWKPRSWDARSVTICARGASGETGPLDSGVHSALRDGQRVKRLKNSSGLSVCSFIVHVLPSCRCT